MTSCQCSLSCLTAFLYFAKLVPLHFGLLAAEAKSTETFTNNIAERISAINRFIDKGYLAFFKLG
jgi:hypothetical protein